MRKSKKVKIKKSIKKMWATWVNCTVQLHLAIELDPNPSGDCLFMGQKGLCKKKKKKGLCHSSGKSYVRWQIEIKIKIEWCWRSCQLVLKNKKFKNAEEDLLARKKKVVNFVYDIL